MLALALTLITLAAPALPAGAQEDGAQGDVAAETSEADRVIQILNVTEEKDLVTVDVAIPGVINELQLPLESNFGVALNGVLIDSFEVVPQTTAVDAIVVVDTSSSMRGTPLRDAKLAAVNFIEQLPEEARVGVIGFGEVAEVLSTPTLDREQVLADVDGLQAVGQTALWEALVAAADVAADADDGTLTYVIVLADGDNSVDSTTQTEAINALDESGAGLYAIAIESGESNGAQLSEVAAAVDGIFSTATDTNQLDGLYASIAERLASRYRLEIRPNSDRGGNMVISVGDGASVATSRTRLAGLDSTQATPTDPEGPARVLNVPEEATLGVVGTPDPGILGQAGMLPIGAAAVFLSLLLLGWLMVNPASEVRLDTAAGADRIAGINQRLSSAVDRIVAKRDEEGELDKALDAAGLNLRPGEFLLMALVVVVLATFLGFLLGGMFLAIVMASAGAFGVLVYLNRRAQTRRAAFADQLIDTLTIMIGSLKAGRGLPQAIELVAAEAPSPSAEQFRRVLFETQVGRDMTESMMGVANRMKSQDFEWVAKAIDINRELGGNLTEVLGNVTETVRERRRIQRMVKSLSAEGRASGWVLLALPVVMFLFLWWRTPENVALMIGSSLGRVLLGIAVTGMVVGYIWIRRLVDLKY